jgi:flagellar hook-length control protein FliK
MPSTATTNITIATILDLIGPATVTPAADGPPFDSLLQPEPRQQAISVDDRKPSFEASHSAGSAEPAPQALATPNQGADQQPYDDPERSDDASSAVVATEPAVEAGSIEHEDSGETAERIVADALAGLSVIAPMLNIEQLQQRVDVNASTEIQENLEADEFTGQQKAGLSSNSKQTISSAKLIAEVAEAELAPASAESNYIAHPKSKLAPDQADAAATQSIESKTVFLTDALLTPEDAESTAVSFAASETVLRDVSAVSDGGSQDPTPSKSDGSDPQPLMSADSESARAVAAPSEVQSAATSAVAVAQNVQPSTPPSAVRTNSSTHTATVGAIGPANRARLPAEFFSHRTTGPARPAGIEIDSARLLGRVARAFAAAQERDGEIRLRLSPPELGSLRLDVRVENGALIARLQTETDAARTAIIDNLPALRDRLNEQGVRIERFDVDLMQRQPGGMPDQSGGQQHEDPSPAVRVAPLTRPRSDSATVAPNTTGAVAGAPGGLNVII